MRKAAGARRVRSEAGGRGAELLQGRVGTGVGRGSLAGVARGGSRRAQNLRSGNERLREAGRDTGASGEGQRKGQNARRVGRWGVVAREIAGGGGSLAEKELR